MEEFNIQGKQTPFYKYCPGTFGYTLVCRQQNRELFDVGLRRASSYCWRLKIWIALDLTFTKGAALKVEFSLHLTSTDISCVTCLTECDAVQFCIQLPTDLPCHKMATAVPAAQQPDTTLRNHKPKTNLKFRHSSAPHSQGECHTIQQIPGSIDIYSSYVRYF
jgi:hypothetical protein